MLRIFKRSEKSQNTKHAIPEVEENQPQNSYNEIYILNGHNDIIDFIVKLDEYRVLTASHDKVGTVWDCRTGGLLCHLTGHTRKITSAIVIKNYLDEEEGFCNVVVTSSSDQTIRIWDLTTGAIKRIISKQQGTVKCFKIVSFEPNLLLTAGENICLWNPNLELLTKHQRNSLDYIHTLICIKTDRIVVATDTTQLVVYDIKFSLTSESSDICVSSTREQYHQSIRNDSVYEFVEFEKLPPHRQSITVLILISDAMFASASMDGAIIIWTTHRLDATRQFNRYEAFMNILDHTYPYSIQHLLIAEKRYIFAAIGSGFAIFDSMRNEKCVCRVVAAHHSQVTSMALLEGGAVLATSSLDATVRLWAAPPPKTNDDMAPNDFLDSPVSRLLKQRLQSIKNFPVKLDLIGVCYGHSNSVQTVVDCGKEGFISCSNDNFVILWKDSKVTKKLCSEQFRSVIKKLGWMEH